MSNRFANTLRSSLLAAALVSFAISAAAEDLAVMAPHRNEMVANASGFFIDLDGKVVTARHGIQGCRSLYTLKDGRVARAAVVAVSQEFDLALVQSSLRP